MITKKSIKDVLATIGISAILTTLLLMPLVGTGVKPVEVKKEVELSERYFVQAPSVVMVKTAEGLGTGFFIKENLIATAHHVVDGVDEVEIYFKGNKNSYPATVVKRLEDADIAILEITTPVKAKPLKMSMRRPLTGSKVYVIGHPNGLKWSISQGIISNVNRDSIQNELGDFIQIDAPVNGGNSGGPVFNMRGEVIGVVSYKYRNSDGLGVIVPIKYVEVLVR